MSARLEEQPRSGAGVGALRASFRDGKNALVEHFLHSRATAPAAARLTRKLARHVDTTLIELWTRSGMPPGASLLAVGGYGRAELFPHSDVDVLVLLPGDVGDAPAPMNDALRAAIAGFLTACWDIGLEIGSSVRTAGRMRGRGACRRDHADFDDGVALSVRLPAPLPRSSRTPPSTPSTRRRSCAPRRWSCASAT